MIRESFITDLRSNEGGGGQNVDDSGRGPFLNRTSTSEGFEQIFFVFRTLKLRSPECKIFDVSDVYVRYDPNVRVNGGGGSSKKKMLDSQKSKRGSRNSKFFVGCLLWMTPNVCLYIYENIHIYILPLIGVTLLHFWGLFFLMQFYLMSYAFQFFIQVFVF